MSPHNVHAPRAQRTEPRSSEPFRGLDREAMPADLATAETNIFRRLSPRRNRWPEVQALDERVGDLEQRQAKITAELAVLEQRRLAAPSLDTEALAAWQLNRERDRPTPSLPKIEEEIGRQRADYESLTAATSTVLAEKANYVEKHRPRLVQEADRAAQEKHARVLELIDELAAEREELADLRQAAVWASVFPDPGAGAQLPRQLLVGGLAAPVQEALGIGAQMQAAGVFQALRSDADFLKNAATRQQREIMGEVPEEPRTLDGEAAWLQTPEGREAERQSNRVAREQYRQLWGHEPT